MKGRFSKKLFEASCLREYAETFPTVCGDFAFYQFPTAEFWERLFTQTPAGFRFAFKVPEQITCSIFPKHPRYGPQAGVANPSFLDAEMIKQMFLRPLWQYRAKTALIIFEFGAFGKRSFRDAGEFLDRLDPFLAALPPDFRYSVEVRNPELLAPDYFQCLRSHGVAHVYNAWSKMPELAHQIAMPDSVTADFVVEPGAAAVRAAVRGCGGDVFALHRDQGSESGDPGCAARADRALARRASHGVPVRQ